MSDEHIYDLWEEMDRHNALYEERMWDYDHLLEFVPDRANNCIIIRNKSMDMEKM